MWWNELVLLLKAQATLCEQLIGLGACQVSVVLAGDKEQSRVINTEQEKVFSSLRKIEEKKIDLLRLNKKMDSLMEYNLLQIIEEVPLPERKPIEALLNTLQVLMMQLRDSNRENKKLIDNEIRFVDFNINLMTQATADDFYAPQGQGGSVIAKKKMFDQTI